VNDRFSSLCGSYSYLLKEHKLSGEYVKERIKTYLEANA